MTANRKSGWLLVLGVFLLEIACGFAFGYLGYRLIFGAFLLLGWTGEWDFANVVAIFLAFFVALPPMIWLDRWGERRTGRSAMDYFNLNLPV